MRPVIALLGALGLDYWEHRHGRPTICSTARRHIGPAAFLLGWCFLSGWLVPHYLAGFKIDLEHLTD